MAVTIELMGVKATIQDLMWSCKDEEVLTFLKRILTPPGGADPNPDLIAAQHAIKNLGGEIVDEGPPTKFDPDVIY